MSLRDREKARLVPLKTRLFSVEACRAGTYKGKKREFCLSERRAAENLHQGIRDLALAYFARRRIEWHDGLTNRRHRDRPSNHLCCSQSFCVNTWLPFWNDPDRLAAVLSAVGYPVKEVLPFEADSLQALAQHGFRVQWTVASAEGEQTAAAEAGYVAFEWIGLRNYLRERRYGRIAADGKRERGKGFTSADFAFRFRRTDGRLQIVLGEWKYTEHYPKGGSLRYAKRRRDGTATDRTEIYGPALEEPGCQIQLRGSLALAALMYDPFDQMMRNQFLSSAMEREGEMEADIVSCLHVAPRANRELVNRITAPRLATLGDAIHGVWQALVTEDRFQSAYTEDLLEGVLANAPEPGWAEWMRIRYGGLR